MNIKEIILNERLGATGAKNQPSVFQDIGDFAGRVKGDIAHTGEMLGNVASDTYKTAIDPETYKKAGNTIASGAKYAYNNPGKVAKDAGEAYLDYGRSAGNFFTNQGLDKALAYKDSKIKGTDYDKEFQKQQQISRNAYARSPIAASIPQTVDDAMRAAGNAATFGLADKAVAGVDSVRKGTKYDDEVKAQDAATIAGWERSPNASMAGTIGGSMLDPAFMAGYKVAGKVLPKVLPKATTLPGKIATGATKFSGQTAAGFTGSRAGWDASDTLQGKPIQENDELADIQRLSGQRVDEWGIPKGSPKAPRSAPHTPQNTGIAGLDPGVKKAQAQAAEPNNASYQDRVRAAQQRKSAEQASGPVDPNVSPQVAAQQKQIDALSKQVNNMPKKQSFANKMAWKAGKTAAVGTALAGTGMYWLGPNPSTYSTYLAKQKADRDAAEKAEQEKEEEQGKPDSTQSSTTDSSTADSTSNSATPINTDNDTDNGNPFGALKTNESSDELARVKQLIGYRK